PVDDDRLETAGAQEHHVGGECCLELIVDHRVSAVLDHDDLLVEFLQPRQGLREDVRAHERSELRGAVVHHGGHLRPLRAGHGARPTVLSPAASGRPSARFMDWIAPPAVPLARLSIAAVSTARPARSSTSIPICTALEPRTEAVIGCTPAGRTWTNCSSPKASSSAFRRPSTLAVRGATAVVRLPRAIGASTGVRLTETGDAVTARRFWVISGVWRWVATP